MKLQYNFLQFAFSIPEAFSCSLQRILPLSLFHADTRSNSVRVLSLALSLQQSHTFFAYHRQINPLNFCFEIFVCGNPRFLRVLTRVPIMKVFKFLLKVDSSTFEQLVRDVLHSFTVDSCCQFEDKLQDDNRFDHT